MACGKVLWINTFLWHRHPISKFGGGNAERCALICIMPTALHHRLVSSTCFWMTELAKHTQQPSPSRLSGKAEPERLRMLFRACFRKLG